MSLADPEQLCRLLATQSPRSITLQPFDIPRHPYLGSHPDPPVCKPSKNRTDRLLPNPVISSATDILREIGLTLSRFESILGYKGWNSFVNRRRRPGLSWSGFPRSPYPNDEAIFDEQYPRDDDEDYQRQSAGRDNTPLGLSRFKANAEAWRRKLQRELLLAPLTAAERERIMRWLINLRAREAWQAARLEHTIATKRLLIEALGEEEAD